MLSLEKMWNEICGEKNNEFEKSFVWIRWWRRRRQCVQKKVNSFSLHQIEIKAYSVTYAIEYSLANMMNYPYTVRNSAVPASQMCDAELKNNTLWAREMNNRINEKKNVRNSDYKKHKHTHQWLNFHTYAYLFLHLFFFHSFALPLLLLLDFFFSFVLS